MKKRVFLACLVGLLTATSAYSACDGGTEIKNTAGTTFCMSNVTMNWWSASNWCKVNTMRLATIYEICPSWDGNEGYGKCQELLDANGRSDSVWSSTASGSDSALAVVLSYGNVGSSIRRTSGFSAFCR